LEQELTERGRTYYARNKVRLVARQQAYYAKNWAKLAARRAAARP
jgi:hypothetical protein